MEIVWRINVLSAIRIAKSVQEEVKKSALSVKFKTAAARGTGVCRSECGRPGG